MSAITSVKGLAVWDSRGRPTVEVEVRTATGAIGRAIAPAGASTGAGEARELRDGGTRLRGWAVDRAVANVDGEIARALVGRDVQDQSGIDRAMIALDGTPQKDRLGGNAITAVSLATLWAAANERGVPLWKHLAGDAPVALPVPEIQIFGGGAHAVGSVDVQDYLVVATGATSFAQALEWTAEVYHAAGARMRKAGRVNGVADEGGFWPAFPTNEEGVAELTRAIEDAGLKPREQMAIAIDFAATQCFADDRYHWRHEGRTFTREALLAEYLGWLDRYPIVSIEDPFAEDDEVGMRLVTAAAGARVQIVGDDFFVTDARRIAARGDAGSCNAVLIKPNQIGTVTETADAVAAARARGFDAIVSARSGESEDVTIVHLATGWGVPQLKVGSFSRSERMAKWNEGLRVERDVGTPLAFPARSLFASRARRG